MEFLSPQVLSEWALGFLDREHPKHVKMIKNTFFDSKYVIILSIQNYISLRKITIYGIPCIYPLVRYNQYPQLEEIKLVISSDYMYDDSTENHIICGCTCIYCKQAEKLMTSNRYPKLKKVRVSCFNVTEITLELLKVIQKFSSEITLRS